MGSTTLFLSSKNKVSVEFFVRCVNLLILSLNDCFSFSFLDIVVGIVFTFCCSFLCTA